MHEQFKPQPHRSVPRFSDEEASEVYKRAALIESKTLFDDETDRLSLAQLEDAAKRAGISERAVQVAIDQMECQRLEDQKQAGMNLETRKRILVACVGAFLILVGSGLLMH